MTPNRQASADEKPDFNAKHPELEDGETFVANVRLNEFATHQAKAAARGQVLRLGERAYHPSGKLLTEAVGGGMRDFRPLILTTERTSAEVALETHPECLAGEVLIGNYTQAEFGLLPYASKRGGINAYDINGRLATQPVTDERQFPVFVLESEYYGTASRKKGH